MLFGDAKKSVGEVIEELEGSVASSVPPQTHVWAGVRFHRYVDLGESSSTVCKAARKSSGIGVGPSSSRSTVTASHTLMQMPSRNKPVEAT